MASISQEPYLWVHVAGLALVPVLCDVSLAGLAISEPLGPNWLELGLISALGGLPVLWMQWVRPFYIFSLGPIALVPDKLTEHQQRLLTRFKTPLIRGLVTVAFLGAIGLLVGLYHFSSVIVAPAFLVKLPRIAGIGIALMGFWGCNLFLQISLSAVGVLLTQPHQLAQTQPYPISKIEQDFTLVGLRINRILPAIVGFQEPQTSIPNPTLTDSPKAGDVTADQIRQPMGQSDISAAGSSDKRSNYEEEYDLDDPWS